jgi:1,2-phenylacetyl-CoA epoxidase PaaB subunit
MVEARLYAEEIMVYYGGKHVDRLPRLAGRGGHRIQYRHIIDWLVRKPGAFENYRYRDDLFPTHRFRVAYDQMRGVFSARRASKTYLEVLHLAARQGEAAVDRALEAILERSEAVCAWSVRQELARAEGKPSLRDVTVAPVDLAAYDGLLSGGQEAAA